MNNWIDEISFVEYISSKDLDGFFESTEKVGEPIPANIKNITRTDEEHSKKMGYIAKLIVEVLACNYNAEKYLQDKKTLNIYEIKRTYYLSSEIIELTCSDVDKTHG